MDRFQSHLSLSQYVKRDKQQQALVLRRVGLAVAAVGRRLDRSDRTIAIYTQWAKRFVLHHDFRDPADVTAAEITSYLHTLGVGSAPKNENEEEKNEKDADVEFRSPLSAATQNQALQALCFLYRHVWEKPLPASLVTSLRTKRLRSLPVVPTKTQLETFFLAVSGTARLVALLQYGSGLSLTEALHLRVRDIDLDARRIRVNQSPRSHRLREREVSLATVAVEPLRAQLFQRQLLHQEDFLAHARALGAAATGMTSDATPDQAEETGHPSAWPWQFVFASPRRRTSSDPRSGAEIPVRPHLDERHLLSAYRRAFRAAGLVGPVGSHGLRHAFATHLIDSGVDVRTIQHRLGHAQVSSTLAYLQQSRLGTAANVRSPADDLLGFRSSG